MVSINQRGVIVNTQRGGETKYLLFDYLKNFLCPLWFGFGNKRKGAKRFRRG